MRLSLGRAPGGAWETIDVKLVRGAWKILVGIKDGLVLIAMLLFFGVMFAALSSRPNAGAIKDGALVLKLDGPIVEQPADASPFAVLQGASPTHQYRLRDLVRVIDAARDDKRVKAVVLDLDKYAGAYPAAVTEVANAIGRVRAAGKPVLAYATAYTCWPPTPARSGSTRWAAPCSPAPAATSFTIRA